MNREVDINSWEDILAKCLGDLEKMHPNLKEAQIAEKIFISRASFNRIKNERKLPNIDNILKLLLGSKNTDLIEKAISLVDSDLGKNLGNVFKVSMKEKNKKLLDDELEDLLHDRNNFVTYLLCDLPNGTSLEQVSEVLGTLGLSSLKLFLEKDLLTVKNGIYKIKNSGILVRSFSSVKRHLKTYANFYRPEHAGYERNYIHSLSGGLTLEAQKKVQMIHRKAHEELQKIYRDENNIGDIPSFSVAFCDTFNSMDTDQNSRSLMEELQ